MTDQLGALACLLEIGVGEAELQSFEAQWRHDRLVMDKWFSLQVVLAAPEAAVARAERLSRHADFDWKNPNRFRAVVGALSANHAGFHAASGAGYRFIADWLIRLDTVNPQTAARMSTAFETWRRYDADRQGLARAQLQRMLDRPDVSRDLAEMTSRLLGAMEE
jgi:aminopeptidase N